MVKSPRYYESLDFKSLWAQYPTSDEFLISTYLLSVDELRSIQNERFIEQMDRAWKIPFYQLHWKKEGMLPGDIKSLDDLNAIPPFDVTHLRDAIDRSPPWGDFVALDLEKNNPLPLVLQTSGGTTGLPRAMLYSPKDREVMNINTGRRLYMQGVRPFDVIQVMLSLGLSNGGFLVREGIWKYSGAIPVMTGSGAQTPTLRQIEIMQAWKTKHLVGFPAYIRKIGQVMKNELNMDPRSLGIKSLILHLGVDDRESLEELWGAKVYDTYGTNECGSLSAECEYQSGSHVFEDSFVLEIKNIETGEDALPGEKGVIYQTTLFKHVAPLIRFNSADISAWSPGACACGSHHKRLQRIFGRSDNMIKLRGTNVFPEAVGAILGKLNGVNGEYVCIVEDFGENFEEKMTVKFEIHPNVDDVSLVEKNFALRLKESLGVKLLVQSVAIGSLDEVTGLSSQSKIKRLIDLRKSRSIK
jgi:phenylacetate-CoA ligase